METEPEQHGPGEQNPHSADDHGIEALKKWFIERGGWINPDVSICYDEARGYHFQADRQFDTRFTLATCPGTLTLSYLNLDHSHDAVAHVDSPLCRLLTKLDSHILSYLLLIEQLTLEDKSLWHPYIDCLPEQDQLTALLWFPENDLKYLRGTPLLKALEHRKALLRSEWKEARAAMEAIGLGDSELFQECDFDTYKWAATIFASRAFISTDTLPDLPTFPILFPVVDIANHSHKAKVRWQYPQRAGIQLDILDTVSPGQEILNNYGPKGNAELLLGSGFAIEDNPVEQVDFSISLPEDVARQMQDAPIPFGMDMSPAASLAQSLRPEGHLLGRYKNDIPFFRGFPPRVVLAALLLAANRRYMKLTDAMAEDMPGNLVLGTLLFLYQPLQVKCAALENPYQITTTPANINQRNVAVWREGQAKIWHNMRKELKAVLESLREGQSFADDRPAIMNVNTLLNALIPHDPDLVDDFEGCIFHLMDIKIRDVKSICKHGAGARLWVLLLMTIQTRILTTSYPDVPTFFKNLLTMYPLDCTPDGEPIEVDDITQDDFIRDVLTVLSVHDSGLWGRARLCHPGLPRLINWAMHVAKCELFVMPDDSELDAWRYYMYIVPRGAKETWMYDKYELENSEPEGLEDPWVI